MRLRTRSTTPPPQEGPPYLGTLTSHREPQGWDVTRAPRWLPRALFQVVVAVFLGIFAWRALASLGTVITILVISWFLSLAMEPGIAWLVRHKMKRGPATGLVMLGTVLAVVVVLALFGGLFVTQLIALINALPRFYADLSTMLDERFNLVLPPVDDLLDAAVSRWDDLAPGIVGVGTSLVAGLFTATAVLLVTYYMSAAGASFRAAICRMLAPHRQREVLRIWEVSQEKVSGFILSRLVLAGASTAATWAFLEILRIPYALPMAAFTGVVSQFVPTVGTYLGGALPVAVSLSQSPTKALGVVIFIVVYQQIENLLLSPKVSQQSLQLNPAIAFLSVLAFGAVFGALGAFLSLPVAAVIQAVSSTFVQRHELIDSELLREPSGPAAKAQP